MLSPFLFTFTGLRLDCRRPIQVCDCVDDPLRQINACLEWRDNDRLAAQEAELIKRFNKSNFRRR